AINKLGYEKDKTKSSAKHLVLKHHLNGKILVPTQKSKSGSWLYYELGNDLKKGGSLIDLLLKNGWNWSDIKELTNENYAKALSKTNIFTNITTNSSEFSSQKQTELAKNLFEEIINDKRINYLIKRDISPRVFKDFDQVRTNKFSAIFGLYTDFNKEKPRLCSTIRYISNREGITKKFFQKNLPRGLSILKNNQSETSRTIITESPIDALSYRELEINEIEKLSKQLLDNEFIKDNTQNELENKMKEVKSTMYVSTCGSITEKIKQDLIPIFNKSSKVILAFDNDSAGKRMTKKLENILDEKNIQYESIFPKQHKDWNDELSAIKNRNIIKISSNNEILKKTYEKIPQTDFENSILNKSNINEATVKDLKGFRYDENRVVFKLYKYNAGKLEFNNLFSIGINDKVLEKKFFRDKNDGLVVLNKLENPKKIVFACSPIDLLKYRQISLKNNNISSCDEVRNITYISNCFNKSEKLFNQIEEIISMNKHKDVKFEIVTTKDNIHDLNKICELFRDQSIDYTKTEIKKDVSYFNGIANTIFSIASKLKYSRKTQESDYDENENELIRGHRR
ncbi:MAG: hypothetical protein GY830_09765, partial [Bacteroidetes bacterium]|nr:hypothetical protein [Bacteroidota bacterium]